jgi:formate dehydrogenase iron-sulfur subunit
MRFSEVEQNNKLEWLIRKDGCMHCADPGCLKACPSPGAIIQYANGIVDFHQENCIGCGYCVTGCPFNVPRISQKDSKAYKCTLCSDRVAVNQAPACAKSCPTGAIQFGSKEDMKDYASKRITDLKERGYEKAGLYDPQGVGGTHVMYVLQHADQPGLYAGLPENPLISPLVSLWKGFAKPLATLALAGVALGSLFHYVTKGPNEVSKETEDEIEREDKEEAK